jgi:GGDEF domain-containing protein
MSLQGPLIVVAEQPAAELTSVLSAGGAFPIVETNWTDAPTAFISVKPSAVIVADPAPPPSEAAARMLGLQIATANGPIVPAVMLVAPGAEPAIANALAIDADQPIQRLIARLQSALRVRALHATVLRRCETFAAEGGVLPQWPGGDALDDATVLAVGRGPLYAALAVAMGERVKTVGALSLESAQKHLAAQEFDGLVIGDGFLPRAIDSFLDALAQNDALRDLPIAVMGHKGEIAAAVDHLNANPALIVTRMLPFVRLHAFATRLKRMLASLDAGGILDPATGLLTRDCFFHELGKAIADASDRSQPLSLARFSFETPLDPRAALDGARLVTRLTRAIDFAAREDDGSILVAFTQTDLRNAHVVARRIAAPLKTTMLAQHGHSRVAANITLATLKMGDTPDTLMLRVQGRRLVAAE